MAGYQETLMAYLEADSTLSALLTGGWYDSSDLPIEQITADNLPGIWEADGMTLKPFGAITWREQNMMDPSFAADRQFIEGYIYQDVGYTTINAAMARIKALFRPSRRFAGMDDATTMFVLWTNVSEELESPDLYHKPMKRFRLQADLSLFS